MNKLASYLLIGSVLAMTVPVFAENRAVNIALGSTGGPLDNAALQTVRQVIGYAVARGTVDIFMVVSSGEIEGGIAACAEAGFLTEQQEFTGFCPTIAFYSSPVRDVLHGATDGTLRERCGCGLHA